MRDTTRIPDELLAVIARAIRLHVHSCCASLVARIDTLERVGAREPVVNVTSFPVKDHTESIDSLRRTQEALDRQSAEDRRALDRLVAGIDGIGERVKTLETRTSVENELVVSVKQHTATIDDLGRALQEHGRQVVEDRRSIDRLQDGIEALGDRLNRLVAGIDGIGERVKTLETRASVENELAGSVKQHTATIDDLGRALQEHGRQVVEDRRSIDRLQDGIEALGDRLNRLVAGIDGIGERIKTLETRASVENELAGSVKQHTVTIDDLGRAQPVQPMERP
ncbi:hypothetical protein [Caballeronia sp. INML1]|uniref:hypothetical protein n=1 Tax=Caballeronia sp. INML1 TaxID=2921760 RepID=UPI00202943FF|nr:hypothetical protein [Caballeronia sp. INML1]